MTFEIGLVLLIFLAALIIFALDIFPIDFVAFGLLTLILAIGPVIGVSPEEAISGFSNPATITVMAMFILSGGIYRTGAINILAHRLAQWAGGDELRQLAVISLMVGPISAFINNTAAVAILMPAVVMLAREHHRPPSKLLMPLSFFSQLAGVITLIGTSTNILASALAAQEGYGEFSMFEFSSIGLAIFLTGMLYMLFLGRKLVPDRRVEPAITENYRVKEYLSEVVVLPKSSLVGKSITKSRLSQQFDIRVLEILRQGQKLYRPIADQTIRAGDILLVRADPQHLLTVKDRLGLAIESERDLEQVLENQKMGLLEVVIGPNCSLIGDTIESTNFRNRYGCTVIAMQKSGGLIGEGLAQVKLDFGDTFLLRGTEEALNQVKRESGFIVIEELQLEMFRTSKIPVALAIVAGVVGLAAGGYSILVTSMVGCVLMVLTGCLRVNELHAAIRWDVILLLAGVIPLGLALERSGGSVWLAELAAQTAVYLPSWGMLIVFYLTAMLLTELISNNATVVVLVPVGVTTAETLGLDARAFILTIMFAASTSFSTPVGYQTNTMIYGAGGYKFLDFTRVGGPLNLLLAVTTPIYIYWLWGV